jgi:hypothetical protein
MHYAGFVGLLAAGVGGVVAGECTWTRLDVGGASPRRGHGMAYDSARGVTVLFGGYHNNPGGYYGDTWEWDGARWSLRATTGPTARDGHAMV